MINVALYEFHINFFLNVEKKKRERENKGKKGGNGVGCEGEKLLIGTEERKSPSGTKVMK